MAGSRTKRARSPRILLVRSDATPRRMRVVEGQLRTRIGYENIVHPKVESIRLADVVGVEVLAPYAPPGRRLAAIWSGATLGAVAASTASPMASLLMAVVFATFAAVCAVVGSTANARYNLARLDLANGGSRILGYAVEDQDEVKALFGAEAWREDNMASPDDPLLPEEAHHAEALRIGIVLAAGGLSLAVLMIIFRPPGPEVRNEMIPQDILQYAAISIVVFVIAMAWVMMIRARSRRR